MSLLNLLCIGLSLFCLISANVILFKEVEDFNHSKLIQPCFLGVKFSVILPIIITALILFTFTYDFVGALKDEMWYSVFYYYIVYVLLLGLAFIVQEHQYHLHIPLAIIIFIFQVFTNYKIATKSELFKYMGTMNQNIFRYGDVLGYLLCFSGAILSFLSILTLLHYKKRRTA